MAIVRNTSPSTRQIGSIELPPKTETPVPDDVLQAYRDAGPGREALFHPRGNAPAILSVKGPTKVLRMEGAPVNARPPGLELSGDAPTTAPKKRAKKKKAKA